MRSRRVGLAVVVGIIAVAVLLFVRSDPTLHHRQPSHLILDRHGHFLAEVPGSHEAWGFWPVPATIPDKVLVTTLETEDRAFFEHAGVHVPSVARAVLQNLHQRRVVSGASTIAMQVARLQHPKSRTPWAKLIEATEALRLVHRHGHDAVLRQYLTIAPYGNRCHGVVRAARLYFDKPVEDLSWLQAAYLAALPQQPSKMTPWKPVGHAAAMRRARRILKQLHERGLLTQEELQLALTTDLSVVEQPRRNVEAMHAILRLSKSVAEETTVLHRSTIDLELQRQVHELLNENLDPLRGAEAGNSAAVVMALPSGEVLASVGSADYFDLEHRGAIDFTSTPRSPGSALKPFIYGLALEKGTHTAATVLADTPVEYELTGGGAYAPENITHTYVGPMLLREALGNSRNIPALRVLSEVGVDAALERLERGGVSRVRFDPEAYGLSLAIGGLPVTPLELTQLYSALANEGLTIPPRFLLDAPLMKGERVLSPDAAALTAQILADPAARLPSFPASSALTYQHAVSVKTGTSQGYRDAWAVAFDDRVLVVSWVGNHDHRRMHHASGANAAAPLTRNILELVSPTQRPHVPLPMERVLGSSFRKVEVCAVSGALPGPGCTHLKSELFIAGTQPLETCAFHTEVPIDVRNGLRAGASCPSRFVRNTPMLDLPESYAGWAHREHLTVAPRTFSPLCPAEAGVERTVTIREPRQRSRFLVDPNTPHGLSSIRLAASVTPASEEVVWLVDDLPVGSVGYPYELHWPLAPGAHVIKARLASSGETSAAVTVFVND